METIGDRIRRAREAAGLTQNELAIRIGVGPAVVSRWERGETLHPKSQHLGKAAAALEVSLSWLQTGAGDEDASAEPEPPYWSEFLRRYEHLDTLGEEDLRDIRRFGARALHIRSWTDWERIAEIVRVSPRRPPPEP